ncbi:MAG: D-lactate ferricytochrome c oxidoreductase [Chaenotheca gracillima]|nr:MAG: D-lactate ferricytochrome c oxidoreductase [Chaenotheca gracillima]
MARPRAPSAASENSSVLDRDQELGSMYDYLAKIVLLGPSGTGKSCLLHRFVKNEFRVLSSQTIGVEFSSKIIKVGTGARRKRIKLQLWDTAGTERFRSVSRSYYRGAAGAVMTYDVASHASFKALPTFLNDARALASPNLTVILVGNKSDLASTGGTTTSHAANGQLVDGAPPPPTPSSVSSKTSSTFRPSSSASAPAAGLGSQNKATVAPEGQEVTPEEASRWASTSNIPVAVEASALSGDNVDDIFARLARMILTKIELGEVDPDDPQSGIQYGDSGGWGGAGAGASDGASMKSGLTVENGSMLSGGGATRHRKRGGRARGNTNGWMSGMREWEEVFRLERSGRRRRGGCC